MRARRACTPGRSFPTALAKLLPRCHPAVASPRSFRSTGSARVYCPAPASPPASSRPPTSALPPNPSTIPQTIPQSRLRPGRSPCNSRNRVPGRSWPGPSSHGSTRFPSCSAPGRSSSPPPFLRPCHPPSQGNIPVAPPTGRCQGFAESALRREHLRVDFSVRSCSSWIHDSRYNSVALHPTAIHPFLGGLSGRPSR